MTKIWKKGRSLGSNEKKKKHTHTHTQYYMNISEWFVLVCSLEIIHKFNISHEV
jgi:hypothetical protein